MTLESYFDEHGPYITQESERLFVREFLYPLVASGIAQIKPQQPFVDATGRRRFIDFAYRGTSERLAFEIDGESYHAEGAVPVEQFDDSLHRQNEILRSGYRLIRFSYNQLQSPRWRAIIAAELRGFITEYAPELLGDQSVTPTPLQAEVLQALEFARSVRRWRRGVVVLPTGTGKTILSALDAKRVGGRVLFLVHRLDILAQSADAYRDVWPEATTGFLTGDIREDELTCDVLFASKETLRRPAELARFPNDWFDYVVVDEVHHGQSPSYRGLLDHFHPQFMLGLTATPDRTDRKDIFELFEYNKVFELPLHEAIERGFLVPFTYFGLTDNVDYSRIRFDGHRYRVDDLERQLIVPERNEAILYEYLDKGGGDKAIGFCVSIDHAIRMAELFVERGVPAAAIHSREPAREQLLDDFRENRLQVAFTVDLFNEGVDFPNVRVLLFLRPTESKTIFLQQLGRGLRLAAGKDRVVILDFIGNYRRANQIRRYLAEGYEEREVSDADGRRRKLVYTYATGCEVVFDAAVEEILDNQDAADLGVDKRDLSDAYFLLAEKLGRKPTRQELDELGAYKSAHYSRLFGSWRSFLREVGEFTEASYHYPQGVHVGHLLAILQAFGTRSRAKTEFDDRYIRLRGGLAEGRLGSYQRQVKYKLLAAMELGLLTDDRQYPGGDYELELTPRGVELRAALGPVLSSVPLTFPRGDDGIPSTRMESDEAEYNAALRELIGADSNARRLLWRTVLGMHAAQQMLAFLYQITRAGTVRREQIYTGFFQAPFVRAFCDQEGIEEASLEASRRRCPFLINLLDACGIVSSGRETVAVDRFVLTPDLVRPYAAEDRSTSEARLRALKRAWPMAEDRLASEDLSIFRELYGPEFLTDAFRFDDLEVFDPAASE